jgi:dipeptidase
LFDLLGVEPERALCTPTSGYVFVAQLRRQLPDAIGNLLWFAYGPADTSCFVPLYAGITELPDTWDHPANFTRIDRQQAQWNFRLTHNLARQVRYQEAIQDIRHIIRPAEANYLKLQPGLEQAAESLLEKKGPPALATFLNTYALHCTSTVGTAYSELVDYLLLRYLVGDPEFATPILPRIAVPVVPELPSIRNQSAPRPRDGLPSFSP